MHARRRIGRGRTTTEPDVLAGRRQRESAASRRRDRHRPPRRVGECPTVGGVPARQTVTHSWLPSAMMAAGDAAYPAGSESERGSRAGDSAVSNGVPLSRRAALRILTTATVVWLGSSARVLSAGPPQHRHGSSGPNEDSLGRRRRAALRRDVRIYLGAFATLTLAAVGWVIFMTVRHRRARLAKKPATTSGDAPAAPRPFPRHRRRW